MRRHPNPRLVKMHRSYTVEETARLLGKHKNPVRAWIKQGLQPVDGRKPTLIHGLELVRFLQHRRMSGKRPCPPSHMYCVKCRSPKRPAAGMADYLPITDTAGNLHALCVDCGRFMHRRGAFAKFEAVGPWLESAFPRSAPRLRVGHNPAAHSRSPAH